VSFTDIIQLVGPKSVPFFVAGSVYYVFGLGEQLASQRAKDVLSKWLLTFDVQKAKSLPEGTQQLFERIFGERHFSLKCDVLTPPLCIQSQQRSLLHWSPQRGSAISKSSYYRQGAHRIREWSP
jgi:hypothetical protein